MVGAEACIQAVMPVPQVQFPGRHLGGRLSSQYAWWLTTPLEQGEGSLSWLYHCVGASAEAEAEVEHGCLPHEAMSLSLRSLYQAHTYAK